MAKLNLEISNMMQNVRQSIAETGPEAASKFEIFWDLLKDIPSQQLQVILAHVGLYAHGFMFVIMTGTRETLQNLVNMMMTGKFMEVCILLQSYGTLQHAIEENPSGEYS